VLGDGAHPDPAADLAPVIARARAGAAAAGRVLDVLVLMVGTEDDPQGLAGQIRSFADAGAQVCRTVGEAVDRACRRLAGLADGQGEPPGVAEAWAASPPPVPLAAISEPLAAVNVGLESFYTSLVGQGAAAVHVDWRPPAGGNERLGALLAKMKTRTGA
jgi:FdrA protein